jgi:hypothetical protein
MAVESQHAIPLCAIFHRMHLSRLAPPLWCIPCPPSSIGLGGKVDVLMRPHSQTSPSLVLINFSSKPCMTRRLPLLLSCPYVWLYNCVYPFFPFIVLWEARSHNVPYYVVTSISELIDLICSRWTSSITEPSSQMEGFDDLLTPSRNALEDNPFADPFTRRSGSPDPWATPFASTQRADYYDQSTPTAVATADSPTTDNATPTSSDP